ncbi:MAG: SRPBCC domain-containing protein [Pseudomonadota bacterium]
MANQNEIQAIEKTLYLSVDCQQAFDLFTSAVEKWWPLGRFSVSANETGAPARACAFDPKEGGEFYEITADGRREVWGTITVWRPGEQLSFTWRPALTSEEATHVSITFERDGESGCVMKLTHSGWEARGEEARTVRDDYNGGWQTILSSGFKQYAEATVSSV